MDTTLSDLKTPRPVSLAGGGVEARQRAVDLDRALLDLCTNTLGPDPRIAIVAVGGYGTGSLSPHSDVDLLFLFPGRTPDETSAATLRNVLYPLWDAGFQVGHASVTPKGAIERCASDLHAATSLLSARLVAGAGEPFDELLDRRTRLLRKQRKQLVRRITASMDERHRSAERAGWALAPDIKNDVGGLRDHDTVRWLQQVIDPDRSIPTDLSAAVELLLAVREALHSVVNRKQDRLHIDLQPRVAALLGAEGDTATDDLMGAVHRAARTIEFRARLEVDTLAASADEGPRRSGTVHDLGSGIRLQDGKLSAGTEPDLDTAVRLVSAVGSTGKPPDTPTLETLARTFAAATPAPWTPELLDAFVDLLQTERVEDALELLDNLGGWKVLLPEWTTIRGRAQHDPYHRYTVDGHSFKAVASIALFCEQDPLARAALDELSERRVLYLATLMHDIGKGSGEDHSIAGERLARAATERAGLPAREVAQVATLVRHHLLLSDTATRRDIDDGAVVTAVAEAIGDPDVLRALYVLSGADGLATGSGSWGPWKASLVAHLYRRVLDALERGETPQRNDVGVRLRELEAYDPLVVGIAARVLPTLPAGYIASTSIEDIADDVRLLADPPPHGRIVTRIDPGSEPSQKVITVCLHDRPGTLARTSGVLTLHRISVLHAQAYTSSDGLALERFVVTGPEGVVWQEVEADLGSAYSGRLALEARIGSKARDYRPNVAITADVRILQDESPHSTVVEVRSPDALGLLYAVTAAISDLELDIHVAKIDTLGERVVDVFYVRSLDGAKLDRIQEIELRRAVAHRIERLFGQP